MPAIKPTNPYPTIPTFTDIPGIDRPTTYAATSSFKLPPSVSTPATQRIGMEQEVQTSSTTSLALTGSDGARLGFGERVGAVTVFGTDINPGSATQAVDSRRQGTSVTTFTRFDNLIYPLIRVTDNKLTNKTPFVNFKANPEAFGQPKLFHNPEGETAKYAFLDIPGDTDPVTYIKRGEGYLSYPFVLDLINYKEPDQLDGTIEVFDVRKSFAHTSITDYNFMKGAHADLGGGYLHNNKGTSKLSSIFERKAGQSIDFFEDAEDLFFSDSTTTTGSYTAPGLVLRKFAAQGIVSDGAYKASPYNDEINYVSESYNDFDATIMINATFNQQMAYNLNYVWQSSTVPFYKWNAINIPSTFLRGWWRLNKNVSTGGNIENSALSGAGSIGFPAIGGAGKAPVFDATDAPSKFISTTGGTCKFESTAPYQNLAVSDSDKLTFASGGNDLPFSISTWLKLDPASATTRTVIAKYQTSSPSGEWFFYIRSDSTAELLLWDNTNSKVVRSINTHTLPNLEWFHLAVTYNGQAKNVANPADFNGIKIYVNGEAIPTGNFTYLTEAGYACMVNTTKTVTIGTATDTSGTQFLGNIAEVALLATELTENQVKALYDGGKNGPYYKSFSTISQMLNSGSVGPYSKMSEIGTRFKSATCGLQFGESNILGTDSIAFGGLKK